jgi:hypothetical protein
MTPVRDHRPTNDQEHPQRRSRTSGRRQVGAVGAAFLIVAGACGGSDDDSSGDAEAAAADTESAPTAGPAPTDAVPTTEPEPDPTEPEPTDSEPTEPETEATGDAESATTSVVDDGPLPATEWAESMITAWNTYLAARIEGLNDSMAAQMQGVHFFDVTHSGVSTELEALEAYAAALDVQADDPSVGGVGRPDAHRHRRADRTRENGVRARRGGPRPHPPGDHRRGGGKPWIAPEHVMG